MSLKKKLTDRIYTLLSRRDYSKRELLERTSPSEEELLEFSSILETLESEGVIDEQRFAEGRARHRAAQGHGPRRIRYELNLHNIAEETITQALSSIDWPTVWEKRLRKHKPSSAQATAQLAIKYGFPTEIISSKG